MSTTAAKAGYNALVAQHVYLSPHLDDAVFSCGGLIAHQAAAGEAVTVLTICAGDPPPGDFSPFARELHARWEAQDSPIAVRRSEDLAACERLCAGVINLEIPEAIYRRGAGETARYPNEAAIFGGLHEAELDLVRVVAEKLRRQVSAESLLYCPLGYGGHVDHRLTRLAAEGLARPLRYYREIPYALRGGSIPGELGFPPGQDLVFELRDEDIERWVQAACMYRSQISTFWSDEAVLDQELRAYDSDQGGLPILVPGE